MGKTNYAKYDPRTDSSEGAEDYWAAEDGSVGEDGTNPGFYPSESVILIADNEGDCPCGCRQPPASKGRTFRMGHDARLKGKLIRAHISGCEVVQVGPGGLISGPAMTVAQNLGWANVLEQAAQREADRKNQVRAPRKPKAPTGPRVGDITNLKIGRWTYNAEITAVWDDGEIEYSYQTKSGEVKTHTAKPQKEATK